MTTLRAALFLSFAILLSPASVRAEDAQVEKSKMQLVAMTDWMAQVTELLNEVFNLLDPTNETTDIVAVVDDGGLTSEEGLQRLEQSAAETKSMANSLRLKIKEIGPPPKYEIGRRKLKLSEQLLHDIVDSTEKQALETIDLQQRSLLGEEVTADDFYVSIYEGTAVTMRTFDALIDAQMSAIANENHPQLIVGECTRMTNGLALILIKLQFGLAGSDVYGDIYATLDEIADRLKDYEALLESGREKASITVKALEAGKLGLNKDRKDYSDQIIEAFGSYESNWTNEQRAIDALWDLIALFDQEDLTIETATERVEAISELIISVEEVRTDITFKRAKTLGQGG